MYQESKRTCTAIVLLIKPFVWWRSRCRRRRGFVNSLLSVPRREQFFESVARNCEFRGTDNVQGQIAEHIFMLNGGYCIYYPSNIFRNALSVENWGIHSW